MCASSRDASGGPLNPEEPSLPRAGEMPHFAALAFHHRCSRYITDQTSCSERS
jgi:hypothetical protein